MYNNSSAQNLKGDVIYWEENKCVLIREFLQFSVVISRESKWFIACCLPLDLATQGETEREVIENMRDFIDEYLNDFDVPNLEAG
jgi:predicted RNase H-like HicB family nuclease